ncbi:MAG: glycosyltransferase family 2 protein [Bacteroidales bacterium]|nr:glycosyltransferase family 2 protein [Bacteroidales bacterium]
MTKILSLIIPTYNMAELLPRCLDSLLVDGAHERLEVIVVNDGSKDNSLQVMQSYEAKYPDTVVVIDKPNGNYGSTINAALPVAKGKYVKILDSDDWFESQSLLKFLDALSKCDSDIVVTHFSIFHEDGSKEIAKYNLYGKEPYVYGRQYDLDEVLSGGYIRFFLMHGLCYRTDLLRNNSYTQTEGVSYTDLEWDTYPLFYAQSIVFFDINLYQYNMAREGQTMDPKVLHKSLWQLEKVTWQLIDFYENWQKEQLSDTRRRFIDQFYRNRVRLLMKSHLLDMPREAFDAAKFATLYKDLSAFCARNGIEKVRLFPENKIIRIDACAWWEKHHSRFPLWLEKTNHAADKAMTWLYRKIFR